MKTRQKLTEETAKRYCLAKKKEKGRIIDEFVANTGYNRKYAIHILKNSARVKVTNFNNVRRESVQILRRPPRKKRIFTRKYGDDVRKEVVRLWNLSRRLCAKRLVTFIHDNIDYFAKKFSYGQELKEKLRTVSESTIGRMLRGEIAKCAIRGISTTRPAKNLSSLIPVRTHFDWDERKPGFFEVENLIRNGINKFHKLKWKNESKIHS